MEKLTKTITIGLTDDNTCGVTVSPDMDCATAFQLVGTLSLHLLKAFYAVAEDQIKSKYNSNEKDARIALLGIKESMYDAMDSIFSNVLNEFYPEAPRSSIEDEAILELVNSKIEERYNQLTPEEKANYAQAYSKMKLKMEFRNKYVNSETSETTTPTTTE